MKSLLIPLVGLSGLMLSNPTIAAGPDRFEFHEGERIVLIGDTFIEREQKYGYLETLLTIANPGKTLIVRNLGWSGDTVFGDARSGFGTRVDGYRHLVEHVLALKPTVLIVGYGMSDSFEGEAGLPAFVEGLNRLLDSVAECKARIILLSPIAHEPLGRPLPDPSAHNKVLRRYCDAIAAIAHARNGRYLELFQPPSSGNTATAQPRTDNGIHLTPFGYWDLARTIVRGLGLEVGDPGWRVQVSVPDQKVLEAPGVEVSKVERIEGGIRFEIKSSILPPPPAPDGIAEKAPSDRVVELTGRPEGRLDLKVDGKLLPAPRASDSGLFAWSVLGDEADQVERLRRTINEKNLLYFHRWRPQNETYLFGFRKHEQGNNAREIPLFDPLVDEKEKEIARLRSPRPHVVELVRESEVSK